MADESGTGQGTPDAVRRYARLTERRAELFDELGQRSEDLARIVEFSAEVHEQMPDRLWSDPGHVERDRMLADAERAAAEAYRAHQVPPDEVRAAIVRAGETDRTDLDRGRLSAGCEREEIRHPMTSELVPAAPAPDARVDLYALEPGTHLIVLYEGEAELARAAAAFVGAGLAAGDRVLYLASDRPLPAARASLEAGNAAAGPAIAAGQLVMRSFSDVYGGTDGLDLATVAGGFRATADLARTDGFPGLRVAAEMRDLTRVFGSIEQMLVWERMATRLRQEERISSVCQYDQQRLDGEFRELLAAEHAGAAPESATPPQASFLATPQGLRIIGELDLANREAFVRAVRARLAAMHRLTVDVGEVTFIDTGTVAELYPIAARLPVGGRLTVANASPQLRRIVGILGWHHPRLKIGPAAP